jgi:simple sugar transport system permease protein/ribose transport system permease protein
MFIIPFSIHPLSPIYTFAGKARIVDGMIPVAIPLVILIFAGFHFVMKYTTFGRHFMATGGNPRASFISGINTDRIIIMGFIISGVLAAVAGLLAAGKQDSISNVMGQNLLMLAFAGAIMGGTSLDGGKGTIVGMFGGAILLAMITNSLNLLGVNVSLVYAAEGALIFLAILLDRVKVRVKNNILQQAKMREVLAHKNNTVVSSGQ